MNTSQGASKIIQKPFWLLELQLEAGQRKLLSVCGWLSECVFFFFFVNIYFAQSFVSRSNRKHNTVQLALCM